MKKGSVVLLLLSGLLGGTVGMSQINSGNSVQANQNNHLKNSSISWTHGVRYNGSKRTVRNYRHLRKDFPAIPNMGTRGMFYYQRRGRLYRVRLSKMRYNSIFSMYATGKIKGHKIYYVSTTRKKANGYVFASSIHEIYPVMGR